MQAEPQAEVIEIDAEDAPYLDLRDDREWQGYAILKNRSFVHTKAFDPDLLIKIGMYEDFSNIWHAISHWGVWFSTPHHPISLHSSGGGK